MIGLTFFITAPAHPHATLVVDYPALFLSFIFEKDRKKNEKIARKKEKNKRKNSKKERRDSCQNDSLYFVLPFEDKRIYEKILVPIHTIKTTTTTTITTTTKTTTTSS